MAPGKENQSEKRVTNLVSNGLLAENVRGLSQQLVKINTELKERNEERERLLNMQSKFRKHLSWQGQRIQILQRAKEKYQNEAEWMQNKSKEVGQDIQLVLKELRQCNAELAQVKQSRDLNKEELSKLEAEVKLEKESAAAVEALCTQANKALLEHSKQRDQLRQEADSAKLQAQKLKDRVEELAYKLNGLGVGVL